MIGGKGAEDRFLADIQREEARRFLERNAVAISRATREMRAERELAAYRVDQGRAA